MMKTDGPGSAKWGAALLDSWRQRSTAPSTSMKQPVAPSREELQAERIRRLETELAQVRRDLETARGYHRFLLSLLHSEQD